MALHSVIERLRYRLAAKGRHGTHSPFVYDLVENVLQDKARKAKGTHKYSKLLNALTEHYHYHSMLNLNDPGTTAHVNGVPDMVMLPAASPDQWQQLVHICAPTLLGGGLVIVPSIHRSKAHTDAWRALCKDGFIKLSIDLYAIGLLFAKPEFKEKQHFVLKY